MYSVAGRDYFVFNSLSKRGINLVRSGVGLYRTNVLYLVDCDRGKHSLVDRKNIYFYTESELKIRGADNGVG